MIKRERSVYTCIDKKTKNYNYLLLNFHLHFQEKYETQHDFFLVCVVLFVIVDLGNKQLCYKQFNVK